MTSFLKETWHQVLTLAYSSHFSLLSSVSSSPAFPPSCCGSWPRCSQPGRVHKSVEGKGPLLSVGQCLDVRLFATQWTAAHQAMLSFTISLSLLKLMSIESVMPSNHLILCHPLLLLPSTSPALKFIRVFSNELILRIRWPKYWSFSSSISPSNEYSGLIFRIVWLDLRAVHGTLKSLLQHHSSKASIPQCSTFFMVQLSHLYMTTEKTVSVTIQDLCQQSDVSAF